MDDYPRGVDGRFVYGPADEDWLIEQLDSQPDPEPDASLPF